MKRSRVVIAMAALATMFVSGTAVSAAPDTRAVLADQLVRKVTIDGLNRHLIAFQRIADRNGGHRSDPSPGAQESAAYVRATLRAAGFDVTDQEFTYDKVVTDAASITVGARRIVPTPMEGSKDSPVGGVTGPLVVAPVDTNPGCQPEDYAGLSVVGAIALVKRGGCTFTQKEQVAADAGAVGVIVFNVSAGAAFGSVDPARARIPAVIISLDDGLALSALAGSSTTVEVRRHIQPTLSRNIIAQTRTGRTDNVITLGAHLDGVPTAPALNENGTSDAALLEIARQLGPTPRLNNAVRFAWWGAEAGHPGSRYYLRSLSFEQQLDIALYLDVEALGSSNGGYFVYDGDNSDGLAGPSPYGSAQIERAFTAYFAGRGIAAEGTHVGQASGEYSTFIGAGIPTGGPYAGIQFLKTAAQVEKWGGTAGIPYHPCHDAPCDNLGSINRTILHNHADALAYVTGSYAMSTEDVNGVPPRAKRAAARAALRSASITAKETTQ